MAGEPAGRDNIPIPDPSLLTTEQLHREVATLRELLEARLDGYDTAAELLSETVNRTPTVIQTEITHLRELVETRLDAAERLSQTRLRGLEQHSEDLSRRIEDRFGAVSDQFKARDEKVEALAVTAAAQLRAALDAADKLSSANAQAALLANAKTESAFGEQIKSLADKIEVTTRRLDRGEGRGSGAAESRTEQRLNISQVIAALAVLVAVGTLILLALKH